MNWKPNTWRGNALKRGFRHTIIYGSIFRHQSIIQRKSSDSIQCHVRQVRNVMAGFSYVRLEDIICVRRVPRRGVSGH